MSEQIAQSTTEPTAKKYSAPVPKNFFGYLLAFGPGIVVALSWVGTGDLVDNSVAGANYGYALIWVLPIALFFRFIFVNNLAKYPLFNKQQDPSIVRGLTRTHPFFGWVILICFFIYTHLLMSFTISGVGTALHGLFGGPPVFVWSLIGIATVFVVTFKGAYKILENIFKVILAVMVACFVLGMILVGVNWGELAQGFAFEFPEQVGLFDSSLVAASLVLATVGSMANLFYPQFMEEKGWNTPAHRKVQRWDLLFGIVVVFFLGVSIWVVGAETLFGNGAGIETAADIASGLEQAIGPIGGYIFYLGLLGAAWTTVAGSLFALSKMSTEALHSVIPARGKRFEGKPVSKDPFYKIIVIWGLLAVVWSLPHAPGFIVLTVVNHVLTAPMLLVIVIGMLVTMNTKRIMGEHTNRWYENLGLVIVGVAVAIAAVQGFMKVGGMF